MALWHCGTWKDSPAIFPLDQDAGVPRRCRHFTTRARKRRLVATVIALSRAKARRLLHYPSQIFEQVGSNKALSRRADTRRLLQSPELFLFRGCKSAGQTHGGRTATQKRAARPLPPCRNGRNSSGGGRRRRRPLRNDLRSPEKRSVFKADRPRGIMTTNGVIVGCWLAVLSSSSAALPPSALI